MSTITTRAGKGSPLTNNEVDANFTNLNTDKAELSGASFTGSIDVTGTATMDGLTVDGDALVKPASGSAKLYLQTSNTTSDSQLIFGDSSNNNVGGVKYSHSNDAMRFETSGAERLRIDSSGRVGIGTSSPSSSLDIVGDVKSSGNLNVGGNTLVNQASADNKYLKVNSSSSGDGGILLQRANANKWQIASNTSHHLVLDSLGGGNVLIPTGNVGIGTSSVNSNLEIRGLSSNGQVRLGGSTSGVYGKLYSDNDGVFIVSADAGNAAANSYFGVEVDGSERLRITSDGNVGIGTNSPVTFGANTHGLTINGTGNYQHLTLQNNGNSDFSIYTNGANGTIINQESADPLYFNTSGTERMRIDSSGNVGIGTSSPNSYASQTTLTINGQSYGRLDIESAGTLRASLFATAGSTTLSAATDVLSFDTSGGEAMRIDASGRVGIGQSNPTSPNDATDFLHIGSATNQDTSIVLQDAVETWEIYQNDDLSFLFDTTNVMTLQRLTGNVGIGTSSPSALLQLEGSDGTPQLKFLRTGTNIGGIIRQTSSPYGLTYDAIDGNAGAPTHVFRTSVDGSSFTERMRIDSSGNALVGRTSSLSGQSGSVSANTVLSAHGGLSAHATSAGILEHYNDETILRSYGANAGSGELVFKTGGGGGSADSEAARIDSSGTLLIGTSDGSGAGLEISKVHGVRPSVINNVAGIFNRMSSDGPVAIFRKDGTTVGSIGTQGGDLYLGTDDANIKFYNSASIQPVNSVGGVRDNAIDIGASSARFKDLYLSGNMNATNAYLGSGNEIGWGGTYSQGKPTISGTSGGINFYGAGITSGLSATITSGGNLLVGCSALPSGGAGGAGFEAGQSGGRTILQLGTTVTSSEAVARFYNPNGAIGSISLSGSSTSYNTSSDQRLKENIADADDAGSKIDAIQVRKFDWKADGSHQDYGMIAQELQAVAPEAVSVPEDSEEMMGVDYSKLVPMLIKEIQSLRNRVAQLEE